MGPQGIPTPPHPCRSVIVLDTADQTSNPLVHALHPPRVPAPLPAPLPAIGNGFRCPSAHCRDKLPYASSGGYVQHLNKQHRLETAWSLRIPDLLPDIIKCQTCEHFCASARGLHSHRKCAHKHSVVPPQEGQLPPVEASPTPPIDLAPPELSSGGSDLSDSGLLDLFSAAPL